VGAGLYAPSAFGGDPGAGQLNFQGYNLNGVSAFANGLIYGCTIANNALDATNDIDFGAGKCADSTNVAYMAASALTKRLDAAWAVGTNQGGLFSGAIANTTYHCFIIMRPDTGVVDAGFDTSVTAANRPASYTYYRRVGSIIRSGGAIGAFIQTGDSFFWNNSAPTPDYDSSGNRAKAALALNVPSGIRVEAVLNPSLTSDSTDATMTFYDGANTSAGFMIACTVESSLLGRTDQMVQQFTNTSAQIQLAIAGFPFAARIRTSGWIDTRGANG
jgi:hypothetical protein